MKATFENTVDILVKAYFDGTLMRGDCEMCAVGNIVHAAGFKRYGKGSIFNMPEDSCGMWKGLFVTTPSGKQLKYAGDYSWINKAEKMIDKTGYSVEDLSKVEHAFEINYKGEDPMFNSLMACVDVLATIHNIDLEAKESAKKMFVKI